MLSANLGISGPAPPPVLEMLPDPSRCERQPLTPIVTANRHFHHLVLLSQSFVSKYIVSISKCSQMSK